MGDVLTISALYLYAATAEELPVSAAMGWYPDPASPQQLRWWSGEQWTNATRPPVTQPPHFLSTSADAGPRTPAAAASAAIQGSDSPPRQLDGNAGHADDVWLPWQMVELGHLPQVCVRHGKPAVGVQATSVFSRTPLWVIPLAIFSLLIGAVIALALRVTVRGHWPVCPECEAFQHRQRMGMWACFAASGIALMLALGFVSGWLLLFVLPLAIAALAFRDRAAPRWLTNADVDRQTRAVHVKRPSKAFVYALTTGPRRAAQQFASWD